MANLAVYGLLRYGVEVKEGMDDNNQSVQLIDWTDWQNNHFGDGEAGKDPEAFEDEVKEKFVKHPG